MTEVEEPWRKKEDGRSSENDRTRPFFFPSPGEGRIMCVLLMMNESRKLYLFRDLS